MHIGTLVLALIVLYAPLAVDAQQVSRVATIAVLVGGGSGPSSESFRQALRDLGWAERRNLILEYRFAEGRLDRLPALAEELVQLQADVIVTVSRPATDAVRQATKTIPIVMVADGDPVGTGLVASLARPGGNITGLASLDTDLGGKRLELLKEAVPNLSRVAVLWNSGDIVMTRSFNQIEVAAQRFGVTLQPFGVRDAADVDNALASMMRTRPDALFMIADRLTGPRARQVIDFAAKTKLPTMFDFKGFVTAGGLMAYGPNRFELYRRAAMYVDKILKGAKAGHLPVEQPMVIELVINLNTAKALGLTIAPSLLLRADQVIE